MLSSFTFVITIIIIGVSFAEPLSAEGHYHSHSKPSIGQRNEESCHVGGSSGPNQDPVLHLRKSCSSEKFSLLSRANLEKFNSQPYEWKTRLCQLWVVPFHHIFKKIIGYIYYSAEWHIWCESSRDFLMAVQSHIPIVDAPARQPSAVALGDRFWLFIQTLNSARKSFNSIFHSKENSKYSFKENIHSIRQKLFKIRADMIFVTSITSSACVKLSALG